MRKRTLNRANIKCKLKLKTPMLVKSGQATVNGVDMSFLLTYKDGEPHPVIPGSSLKGAIRSQFERICRSLKSGSVCEPYLRPGQIQDSDRIPFCGFMQQELDKAQSWASHQNYRFSCPACRLFGSTRFAGRIAIGDANTDKRAKDLEQRDGVAIDRYSGGAAKGAKFDLEVLPDGEFEFSITLDNFERWQLVAIALILVDLEDGLIQIGSGKSRGLGEVEGLVEHFKLEYYGPSSGKLLGIAGQSNAQTSDAYGLWAEKNSVQLTMTPEQRGLRQVFDLSKSWKNILGQALDDFKSGLKRHVEEHNLNQAEA